MNYSHPDYAIVLKRIEDRRRVRVPSKYIHYGQHPITFIRCSRHYFICFRIQVWSARQMHTQFKWAKTHPHATPPWEEDHTASPILSYSSLPHLKLMRQMSFLYSPVCECVCMCDCACVPRQPETPPLLLATTHPAASTTFPEPHTFNQHLLSHLQVATKCFIAFCCVILPSCTHSQRGVEYAVVHWENLKAL